jgi:Cu(I)/Ag(I) efflux system membrane fusion protein
MIFMKKNSIILLVAMLFACKNNDSQDKKPASQGPLAKGVNNEIFNQSFGIFLNDYYHLKDNFITEVDTNINLYARKLAKEADSLPINSLQADTAIIATAKSFAAEISGELNGLIAEKNLENKRKSFQMVSLELYDLIRTVQYDKEKIYLDHCPMAFNNEGADWLSNSSDIRNPYIPKIMLTCGSIKDSLDFKKK